MSRLFRSSKILSLFALAVLIAVFATGCGDSKSEEAPDAVVKSALDKAAAIKSGTAEVDASLNTGGFPGNIKLDGGGPFDTQAEGGAAFHLDFTVGVAGTEQEFGIVSVDGKNYIEAGGRSVEQKNEAAASFEPGQISGFIKSIGDHLTDVKAAGEADAAGVQVDTYTATLNIKQLIEESRSGDSDIEDLSIPGLGSAGELSESLSTANLTIGIADDGLPHLIEIDMPIKRGANEGGLRGTLILSDIDQPVTIEEPDKVTDDPAALGVLGQLLGGQ